MLETIITELAPAVLSVVAVLISMLKGKVKKVKTAEEIENIAEAKKQKLVAKLNKKNKITPKEEQEENIYNQSISKTCEGMEPLPERMFSQITLPKIKTEEENQMLKETKPYNIIKE